VINGARWVDVAEAVLGLFLFGSWIFLLWRERAGWWSDAGPEAYRARLIVVLISVLFFTLAFRGLSDMGIFSARDAVTVGGIARGVGVIVILTLLASRGRQHRKGRGTDGSIDGRGDPPGP
jgi:thiol:disulfide interchange protein